MHARFDREILARLLAVAMFVTLTVIGLVFSIYLIYSASSLYMYLIAAGFMVLTIISGFFNVVASYSYYRSYLYKRYIKNIQRHLKPMTKFPTVATAVPVYNEDTKLTERNLLRLKKIHYPEDSLKFYLLDDSTDNSIRSELESFSKNNDIVYIHREERKGFKAGALNNLLNYSKEEFIAIFDYDEYLANLNFLMDLLPYFEDKKLSYVQTEKKYAKGTFFSDTINLFDAFFFNFIQPARALNNTAIFAGSCGIIKIPHLKSVGGFPEYVIEDTFFSFESDVHGLKSLYVPKVYALGKPIETFTELVKQQWRYNYGNTQFLTYLFKRPKSNAKKQLPALSNIDYVTHGFGFNYISIILLLFTLISVLLVFSQFWIVNTSIASILEGRYFNLDLEILSVIAFSVTTLTPIILTKVYFKSAKKGVMVFLLNFSLVFIRTKAAILALLESKYNISWDKGNEIRNYRGIARTLRNSYTELLFSIMLFSLGAFAITLDNFTGGLWLLWYSLLYGSTFYMFFRYG